MLVARLGYPGFRLHDLRASAVTNYLDAGVPVHVVRDIAGHNDISVTDKYARRHTSALSLAAESLADYLGRGGQTGGQPSGATRDRTAQ
ncbi:MAG: site-specific integrase [Micrococcales bacterium]|nr:site-specific integrase [Micrococcales bacterium]